MGKRFSLSMESGKTAKGKCGRLSVFAEPQPPVRRVAEICGLKMADYLGVSLLDTRIAHRIVGEPVGFLVAMAGNVGDGKVQRARQLPANPVE